MKIDEIPSTGRTWAACACGERMVVVDRYVTDFPPIPRRNPESFVEFYRDEIGDPDDLLFDCPACSEALALETVSLVVTVELARQLLSSGRRLRLRVGPGPDENTLIWWLDGQMVISECVAGGAGGVIEPICQLGSDYLAKSLSAKFSVEVVSLDAEGWYERGSVCGEVEPNQSSANAAVCDLGPDHQSGWHEGFAQGPAAAERPGRHRWALVGFRNVG